jgi:hypothetical protein
MSSKYGGRRRRNSPPMILYGRVTQPFESVGVIQATNKVAQFPLACLLTTLVAWDPPTVSNGWVSQMSAYHVNFFPRILVIVISLQKIEKIEAIIHERLCADCTVSHLLL